MAILWRKMPLAVILLGYGNAPYGVTFVNKVHLNVNHNTNNFIEENESENYVCNMTAI